MSGFELVPVDGGAPVHLPPGETVLGRGPLLGVSDTRVSRNHGLLENLSGQLRLKPTHLNPCFVQSSLTDDPRPLTRGSWYPLHDGDLFSLLPGKLIYKVVAVGEDAGTARNSQILDEEELPGSPLPDVELTHPIGGGHRKTPPHEEPTLAASANTEEQEDRRTHQVDVSLPQEVDDDDGDIAASPVKSRVLPAWMLAAVAAPRTSSSNPKVQTAEKRSKSFTGASDNIKLAASKKATPTDSPAEAGLSEEEEEERPRKKRRKNKPSDESTVRHHSASNRSEVSEESDRLIEGVRDSVTAISESEEDRELKDEAESVGSKGNSVSVPAASKCQRRTPCPYGKDCYRKNPLHFQECSHPGDTDHEDEGDEDEEAERPECPYGTDCYRKNPQHRKEYKHTKRPARSTRTVPKKTATPDDDDDNDSFINDDSEDLGDDSDWVPPDRDDSDEEDVRRLQREADVFLKKRK